MIQELLQAAREGKDWSWSVVGILAISGGLVIRSFFLRDLLRNMRIKNRRWYHRVQMFYQKRAIVGWFFFALFFIGAILLWRFDQFFLRYMTFLNWSLLLLGCFVVSLICHLRAYARAIVETVEDSVQLEKDF